MLWLVKIWQVSSCGEFMQHLETCLLTAEGDRVFCHLVMVLTVFFHWMCKMKYSCYQEYFGIWLRNAPLVGNPISKASSVSKLSFTSPFSMRKRVSSDPGLLWWLPGPASWLVSLSNYYIDIYFLFHDVERRLCTWRCMRVSKIGSVIQASEL